MNHIQGQPDLDFQSTTAHRANKKVGSLSGSSTSEKFGNQIAQHAAFASLATRPSHVLSAIQANPSPMIGRIDINNSSARHDFPVDDGLRPNQDLLQRDGRLPYRNHPTHLGADVDSMPLGVPIAHPFDDLLPELRTDGNVVGLAMVGSQLDHFVFGPTLDFNRTSDIVAGPHPALGRHRIRSEKAFHLA